MYSNGLVHQAFLKFGRTFDSLHIKAYRNLWIGSLMQMSSFQMQMLARGYFVYELTHSPSLLGVVMAASAVPALFVGLFAGVLADKLEKKRIIQFTQIVSMLLAGSVATLIVTGTIKWEHLLVASIIQGAVMPAMMPSRQAIVPQLVGRERIMNAVALNSMVMSLSNLLAPVAAGWLIANIGIGGAYYIIAAINIGALFFTGLVPRLSSTKTIPVNVATVLIDLREGFVYAWGNRIIILLVCLGFFAMVLSMPIRFLLPIFAKDIFGIGPTGLGIMMSTMGIGSVIGALFVATMGGNKNRGLILMSVGIAAGWVLLTFAAISYFYPEFWISLILLAGVGLFQSSRMTLNNTLALENTADNYRGRVMSIFALNFAFVPAGALPITFATEYIGAPVALGIMAGLLLLIGGGFLMMSSRLRNLP